MNLKNRVVLVTGAARGIGAEISFQMCKAGAKVILSDLLNKEGKLKVTELTKLGYESAYIEQDVTKESSWKKTIKFCVDTFGGLDVLVNNAGIYFSKPLSDISLEEWKHMFSVNVEGVFLGTKFDIEEIVKRPNREKESGSIINLSSVAGIVGGPFIGPYNASKGAVRIFTKGCAMEFSTLGYNVRVNSIHPGVIDTNMGTQVQDGLKKQTGISENEAKSQINSLHPLGRLGLPKEVAKVAVYLASNKSSFITGAEFVVDGGLTAR